MWSRIYAKLRCFQSGVMESAMRMTMGLAAAAALMLAVPARAERPDCGLFPDTRSRFTCYDNVSRAPPEPETVAKPAVTRTKAARPHKRKPRVD
jgi:hypothetical protein